jgi:hypothetical protein
MWMSKTCFPLGTLISLASAATDSDFFLAAENSLDSSIPSGAALRAFVPLIPKEENQKDRKNVPQRNIFPVTVAHTRF